MGEFLYWVYWYLENWVGECSRHLGEYGKYCYWAGFFRLYWVKSSPGKRRKLGDTLIVLHGECGMCYEVK